MWHLGKSGSCCQDLAFQREKTLRLWPRTKDPGGGLCVISRHTLGFVCIKPFICVSLSAVSPLLPELLQRHEDPGDISQHSARVLLFNPDSPAGELDVTISE